jgi:hypothetical protein
MAPFDKKYFSNVLPEGPDFQYRFFCKLFDDMVERNVCILRRGELNDRERFSCSGCSKDRLMTAMSRRRATMNSIA